MPDERLPLIQTVGARKRAARNANEPFTAS